tara:strand:+ start:535 stop:762 length:228 start_codon:yes stop_codon:yes gene_type:complete
VVKICGIEKGKHKYVEMFGNKNNKLLKKVEELEREVKLLRTEIRYLKYLWDLKEIEDRGKETKQTIFVDTKREKL